MSISKIFNLILVLVLFSCSNKTTIQGLNTSVGVNGVFYKGVPYEHKISTNNNEVFFNTKNANAIQIDSNQFRVVFLDSLHYGQVTFFKIEDKQKIILFEIGGDLRPLPVTIVVVPQSKYSGDDIEVNKIKDMRIVADVQNVRINLILPVRGFSVQAYINNKIVKLSSDNNTFSKEQIDMLKMLDDGQPIIIDNIIVEQFDKQRIIREPVVYYISK